MTTTRFATLMRREWMQHHVGWLLVMAILPAVMLAALPFKGTIQLNGTVLPPATLMAQLVMAGCVMAVFGLSWVVAMFQLPGLARRDQQDRSIEFWMSLPAGHGESVAATLLMHAVLVPILALLVGAGFGLIVGSAVLIKLYGVAGLVEASWGSVLAAGVIGVARLSFGVVLMTLWLAPLFMLLMAASAWLKRWGAPLLIGGVLIGGAVLEKVYGNPVIWNLLEAQMNGAGRAFLDSANQLQHMKEKRELPSFIENLSSWAVQDAVGAVQNLASPHLVAGLALAALCYYLVILARKRAV